MEVKIGLEEAPKELELEMDGTVDELVATFEKIVSTGKGLSWIVDSRGRRYGVHPDKLAYVEIHSDDERKRVGFGA